MITNNDLTSQQVSLIIVSLQENIQVLEKKLKQSAEHGIADNVIYYHTRISQTKKLCEIMNNTIGMKIE